MNPTFSFSSPPCRKNKRKNLYAYILANIKGEKRKKKREGIRKRSKRGRKRRGTGGRRGDRKEKRG